VIAWMAIGSLLALNTTLVILAAIQLTRSARTLDMAEGASDQTDRALGWITREAVPAIERVAALAPELAEVLVTHRAVLASLPAAPPAAQAQEAPVTAEPTTQPDIPAQPRRPRPGPGPTTEPDGLPANHGVKRARLTAATDIDRDTAEAGYEHDVEYARMLAEMEDQMRSWEKYRDSLEWTKS
jgi:hypothetical protein